MDSSTVCGSTHQRYEDPTDPEERTDTGHLDTAGVLYTLSDGLLTIEQVPQHESTPFIQRPKRKAKKTAVESSIDELKQQLKRNTEVMQEASSALNRIPDAHDFCI